MAELNDQGHTLLRKNEQIGDRKSKKNRELRKAGINPASTILGDQWASVVAAGFTPAFGPKDCQHAQL